MFGHPVLLRRASAVVTDVGRVAVDAEVAKTNATKAYGKSVWSWRSVAGVKFLRGQTPIRGDGGKKAREMSRAGCYDLHITTPQGRDYHSSEFGDLPRTPVTERPVRKSHSTHGPDTH